MTIDFNQDESPRRPALGLALDGSRGEVTGWVDRYLRGPTGLAPEAVLPLRHRRQPEGWNAYVIALPAEPDASRIDAFAKGLDPEARRPLRKLDHLELQRGLDMFYPRRGGVAAEAGLLQSIEYVRSRPETRAEYYRIQTAFSGPAMRRLHRADRAGRFLGFEVVRVLHAAPGMPAWDVIHVSGFRPWQAVKAVPRFWDAFEDAARAIGEPSGRALVRGWDEQREKRTRFVRQLRACSVSSERLETRAEAAP